jgi:hypothetical protein
VPRQAQTVDSVQTCLRTDPFADNQHMAVDRATRVRRIVITAMLGFLFILALLPSVILTYVRNVAHTDTAYQALVNYKASSHGDARATAWLAAHPTHFTTTTLSPTSMVVATKDAKGGCWTLYFHSGASDFPLLGDAKYCH